jgi:hypothetical protein
VGRNETSVFRLPAGTTRSVPSICVLGNADPHSRQNDLLCRHERHMRIEDANGRLLRHR